jgi:hypothetical protein
LIAKNISLSKHNNTHQIVQQTAVPVGRFRTSLTSFSRLEKGKISLYRIYFFQKVGISTPWRQEQDQAVYGGGAMSGLLSTHPTTLGLRELLDNEDITLKGKPWELFQL